MALSTYSGLKSAIESWLESDLVTTAVDDFIDLAEARLARELRIRAMETALSSTIASGVISVPTDYLELKHAYIDGSSAQWLDVKSPQWIYAQYPVRSSSGKPRFIARDADNFIFGPYPDSTYTVNGVYYAKLTALSTSNETNWLTNNAPDLILYGALVEAQPYVGEDERFVLWERRFDMAKNRVMLQDRMERWPSTMQLAATTR